MLAQHIQVAAMRGNCYISTCMVASHRYLVSLQHQALLMANVAAGCFFFKT